MKSEQRDRLPPGEDRIRKLVKGMVAEEKIVIYEKELKKSTGKLGVGGANRKRILIQAEPNRKLMMRGNPDLMMKLLSLQNQFEHIKCKHVTEIELEDLCTYATLKNRIYRFPVEYAQSGNNTGIFIIDMFDYVQNVIVVQCTAFEKGLGKKNIQVLNNINKLADMPDYIAEPLKLIPRGHQDRKLAVSKYVNPILEHLENI